jgi:hypothetical protein
VAKETPAEKIVQEDARSPSRLGHFSVRRLIYQEKWWETALIPIRVFFQGKDDDPKRFDGRLNPLLFILPFLLLLRPKNGSAEDPPHEIKIWLFFSVLTLCYVFFSTDMRIRYIGPIIPWLVILSVFGIHRLVTTVKSYGSGALEKLAMGAATAAAALFLVLNASYVVTLFGKIQPMGYLSGSVSRDAYIEKHLPEYPVVQYGNAFLPQNARVMALFLGNRRYYSDRDMFFGINFFKKRVKNAQGPGDILQALQGKGVTHVLVGRNLFEWWAGKNFDQAEAQHIAAFFQNHMTILFSKNNYTLYHLSDLPE